MDRRAGLAAIGNTPVVRLDRLIEPGMAEVWVKLEAANPTGSYKDRMALAMVEGAERSGRLQPGQTIVEYTGGSTGSSLAFVCSIKGYPLRIVSSDAFSPEKIRTMRDVRGGRGAAAEPGGHHPDADPGMRARAAEIAAEIGAYQTDQFNNTDMVDGYLALGRRAVRPGRRSARCRGACTSGRPAATWARRGRCASGSRRSIASRSSRPSPRSCPAGRPAPTGSRVAAPGSSRRCSTRRPTSTRSSRCRPPTPWRWRVGPPARTPSGPGRRAARTSRPRCRSPGGSARAPRRHGPGRSGLKYLAGELYS